MGRNCYSLWWRGQCWVRKAHGHQELWTAQSIWQKMGKNVMGADLVSCIWAGDRPYCLDNIQKILPNLDFIKRVKLFSCIKTPGGTEVITAAHALDWGCARNILENRRRPLRGPWVCMRVRALTPRSPPGVPVCSFSLEGTESTQRTRREKEQFSNGVLQLWKFFKHTRKCSDVKVTSLHDF